MFLFYTHEYKMTPTYSNTKKGMVFYIPLKTYKLFQIKLNNPNLSNEINDASDEESDNNTDEETFANSFKSLLQGFQLYFPAKNLDRTVSH